MIDSSGHGHNGEFKNDHSPFSAGVSGDSGTSRQFLGLGGYAYANGIAAPPRATRSRDGSRSETPATSRSLSTAGRDRCSSAAGGSSSGRTRTSRSRWSALPLAPARRSPTAARCPPTRRSSISTPLGTACTRASTSTGVCARQSRRRCRPSHRASRRSTSASAARSRGCEARSTRSATTRSRSTPSRSPITSWPIRRCPARDAGGLAPAG